MYSPRPTSSPTEHGEKSQGESETYSYDVVPWTPFLGSIPTHQRSVAFGGNFI